MEESKQQRRRLPDVTELAILASMVKVPTHTHDQTSKNALDLWLACDDLLAAERAKREAQPVEVKRDFTGLPLENPFQM